MYAFQFLRLGNFEKFYNKKCMRNKMQFDLKFIPQTNSNKAPIVQNKMPSNIKHWCLWIEKLVVSCNVDKFQSLVKWQICQVDAAERHAKLNEQWPQAAEIFFAPTPARLFVFKRRLLPHMIATPGAPPSRDFIILWKTRMLGQLCNYAILCILVVDCF